MATVIEVENMRDGYVEVCQRVLKEGKRVAPRGLPTLELEDVIIVLDDPTDSLPVHVGRKLNPAIAAAEAAQLLGAITRPELLFQISPVFQSFAENGFMWGAYGNRVGAQLIRVAELLEREPDTRRAVITLWDPARDQEAGHLDYPCTVMLAFTVRDERLIMHTTMRSNDCVLGLAYDAFQFTQVQLALADSLGYRPGHYVHHAVSLHVYERDVELVEQLHPPDQPHETRFGALGEGRFINRFAAARNVLTAGYQPRNETERWYCETLEPYL